MQSDGTRLRRNFMRKPKCNSNCLVLHFVLLICAASFALPSFAATGSANDWPMFRGGPGLTGLAQSTLPDDLSLAWSFKTEGPVKSSAAIVNGAVFIGSDDGQVYSLDLASGKKNWSVKTGGPVESSPLVLDG